jgi:hypothetical protein
VGGRGVWTLAGVLVVLAVVSFILGYVVMIRFIL